jgi:hypothetical protein
MEKQFEEIKGTLKDHGQRISLTEATIAPLLSRMDKLVTAISLQSKEQAVANANQTHQAETNKRIWSRIEKGEDKIDIIQKSIDTNANNMDIINKLPLYLATIGFTLMGLVGLFAYRLLTA